MNRDSFHRRVGDALADASSWAAIAAMLGAAAYRFPHPWDYVLAIAAMLAGMLGILLRGGQPEPPRGRVDEPKE